MLRMHELLPQLDMISNSSLCTMFPGTPASIEERERKCQSAKCLELLITFVSQLLVVARKPYLIKTLYTFCDIHSLTFHPASWNIVYLHDFVIQASSLEEHSNLQIMILLIKTYCSYSYELHNLKSNHISCNCNYLCVILCWSLHSN